MKNYSKITENKDILTKEYADSTYANKSSVNNGTLTIQKNGTDVQTFTANQSSSVTANITVPTKVSELTNDSGFLTSHQDISGLMPKSGGTFTGNISVPKTITFTDNTNPFIKMTTGGTDFYF